MTPEQIRRYAAAPVPRYTSYPTAPHFHEGVGPDTYRTWLGELRHGSRLSLYVHVPFCDTLCWFCGCHTKITRKYKPVAGYLETLIAEARHVAAALPAGVEVGQIHWGGGSPTMLEADDVRRLARELALALPQSAKPEFAVEVDPRGLTPAQIAAFADSGLTRVSVGVQDFDPGVQKAINRHQSFEETEAVITRFREAGVSSVNIDAIYGLPGQYEPQLRRTLDKILDLEPDRISLFGYAHVPWMKRHQAMIQDSDLPDAVARHAHAELAAKTFVDAGYVRIGLDHFARESDSMAIAQREGRLTRNFQGYTVDPSDALIGLGASSIGRLPQGYVQSITPIAGYAAAVAGGGLATARGYAMTGEDRVRGRLIERLMCSFAFDPNDLGDADPGLTNEIVACARQIMTDDHDGLVAARGDGFAMTEEGRPFVRLFAARFDAHLAAGRGRHSAAV